MSKKSSVLTRLVRVLGPTASRALSIRHHWSLVGVGVLPIAGAFWLADAEQWPALAAAVVTSATSAGAWVVTMRGAWREASEQLRAEVALEAELASARLEALVVARRRAEREDWVRAFESDHGPLRRWVGRVRRVAVRPAPSGEAEVVRLERAVVERRASSMVRRGSRSVGIALAAVSVALPLAVAVAPVVPAAVGAAVATADAWAEQPVAEPDEPVTSEDREAPRVVEVVADSLGSVVVLIVPLGMVAALTVVVGGLGRRW